MEEFIDRLGTVVDEGMDVNIQFANEEIMQLALMVFIAVLAANIVARILIP